MASFSPASDGYWAAQAAIVVVRLVEFAGGRESFGFFKQHLFKDSNPARCPTTRLRIPRWDDRVAGR